MLTDIDWKTTTIGILVVLFIITVLALIICLGKLGRLKCELAKYGCIEKDYATLQKEHNTLLSKCGNALKVIDGTYQPKDKKIPPPSNCFNDAM